VIYYFNIYRATFFKIFFTFFTFFTINRGGRNSIPVRTIRDGSKEVVGHMYYYDRQLGANSNMSKVSGSHCYPKLRHDRRWS